MLETTSLLVIGALVVGVILGIWLRNHMSSVASAEARATTLPSSDVVALNSRLDGLGTNLQNVINKLNAPVAGALISPATPAVVVTPTPAAPVVPPPAA
jgi:hypothetical protein